MTYSGDGVSNTLSKFKGSSYTGPVSMKWGLKKGITISVFFFGYFCMIDAHILSLNLSLCESMCTIIKYYILQHSNSLWQLIPTALRDVSSSTLVRTPSPWMLRLQGTGRYASH